MALGAIDITGPLAAVLCIWGTVGLIPHILRPERRAAFWLALTLVLLLGHGAVRTAYFDGLNMLMGIDDARAFRSGLGAVRWLLNGVLIVAGWGILRLLHLLLPEEDRPYYSPLTAPFYPARVSLAPLIAHLRDLWRRRGR